MPQVPREQRDTFSTVADELANWLDSTSEYLATAMRAGGRAPFAAPLSEREKLDYYMKQLFLPNGEPNREGRERLAARLGLREYARVLQAALRARQDALRMIADLNETATPPSSAGVAAESEE